MEIIALGYSAHEQLVTEKLTSWSEFLKKNPAYKDLK